jgi:hypothetical protein
MLSVFFEPWVWVWMADDLVDLKIFSTDPERLLEGLKSAGTGGNAPEVEASILRRIGIMDGDDLTVAGRALFDLAWVVQDRDGALLSLGEALRVLLPMQVLDQELRGFGSIPEPGIENLLRSHGAVPMDVTSAEIRRTLMWLNRVKIVVYSTKLRSVRPVLPPDDFARAGETMHLAAMISPKTPYSNLVRLRRVLRELSGDVYWADPHFGARALEDLAFEIDTSKVRSIRIISRGADTVVTRKSLKDFHRFQGELEGKGVKAEWRVDSVADWHDRWLVDDKSAFNMPPINSLYMNQYSEILPSSTLPPVKVWWGRSVAR